MSRTAGVVLAAVLLGCGNLPTTDEGVAFLQVQQPSVSTLAVGDTLRLRAVALDKAGDTLDVPILWRTPDTTVTVDAAGLVTGIAPGIGRVQAMVGDEALVSDFITLTITEPAPAPSRR